MKPKQNSPKQHPVDAEIQYLGQMLTATTRLDLKRLWSIAKMLKKLYVKQNNLLLLDIGFRAGRSKMKFSKLIKELEAEKNEFDL